MTTGKRLDMQIMTGFVYWLWLHFINTHLFGGFRSLLNRTYNECLAQHLHISFIYFSPYSAESQLRNLSVPTFFFFFKPISQDLCYLFSISKSILPSHVSFPCCPGQLMILLLLLPKEQGLEACTALLSSCFLLYCPYFARRFSFAVTM